MSDNSNLAIGAGIGLAAGAGAGLVKGAKKAAKITAPYEIVLKAGEAGTDTFIAAQKEHANGYIKKAVEHARQHGFTTKKQLTSIATRAKEKAGYAFKRLVEKAPEAQKAAKNAKIKTVALLAVAGTAIGAGIAFAVNKVKAAKAQKAK